MATKLKIDGVAVSLRGRVFSCPEDPALESALNRWAAIPGEIDGPSGTPEGKLRAAAEAEWNAEVISFEDEGVNEDAEY